MKKVFLSLVAVVFLSVTMFARVPANNFAVDFNRIAAFEASADQKIAKDPKGAERLLSSIQAAFDQPVFLLSTPSATVLPRANALLKRFGSDATIKVASEVNPFVREGGYAAMVIDKTVYMPADLETIVRNNDDLQVIVAHELGHDRMDSVRKRIYQTTKGITPAELNWLSVRIEAKAWENAMRRLTAAGLKPEMAVGYVKRLDTGEFDQQQLEYLQMLATSSLAQVQSDSGNRGERH